MEEQEALTDDHSQYAHPGEYLGQEITYKFEWKSTDDTPPTIKNMETSDSMTKKEIYMEIKMLSSFMSHNDIKGNRIRDIAADMCDALNAADKEVPRSYGTLCVMAGSQADKENVDKNLYENLYKHFNIYIHDVKNDVPHHKCLREECTEFCILPMFARRCISDRKVPDIFQKIKTMIRFDENLIDKSGELNEMRSAGNVRKFIAKTCDSSDTVSEGSDTLFAISGDCETIFNENAKVDSRLYEMLLTEFRRHDYGRISTGRIGTVSKSSLPWLTTEEAEQLRSKIQRLEGLERDAVEDPELTEGRRQDSAIHPTGHTPRASQASEVPGAQGHQEPRFQFASSQQPVPWSQRINMRVPSAPRSSPRTENSHVPPGNDPAMSNQQSGPSAPSIGFESADRSQPSAPSSGSADNLPESDIVPSAPPGDQVSDNSNVSPSYNSATNELDRNELPSYEEILNTP